MASRPSSECGQRTETVAVGDGAPALRVDPVVTAADLRQFIRFPFRLYAGDPHWVAPLLLERRQFFNQRRNPFFHHAEAAYFVARRGTEVAGTIAAAVDGNYVAFHQAAIGYFGFFECIDDDDVAASLFAAARTWLRAHGMTIMRGPNNFTTNQEVGLLVDGFDCDPVVLTTYNPPYYQRLYEQVGLIKAKDLYAYWLDAGPAPPALVEAAERTRRRHQVRIAKMNLRDYGNEAKRVQRIYNQAWAGNWGFVPVSDEEILDLARNLRLLADPDLALFAYVDGEAEPVGFVLCLPDINRALKPLRGRLFPLGWLRLLWARRHIDFLRIFTLGVLPDHHPLGIGALLYLETWQSGLRKGYRAGEMSWILEDNGPMNAALQLMGARIYKRWRIYDQTL
ncbi:MAG: N-acetyltransferase [Deltaproteobacteria bacterium]|nr:N-acetyltransferase [Deltaproteobacteria bacterium]